ncbi:hypothetical protein GCM10009803_09470 [Microbacterium ginsengiterrae]
MRVHRGPRRVALAFVRVTTGQTRRAAGHDQRTDHGVAGFERDGEVDEVVVHVTRKLMRGRRAADEHDPHRPLGAASGRDHALVAERDLHARLHPGVVQPDVLQPDRCRRGWVGDEHGLESLQQRPRGLTRGTDAVRDDIE